MTIGGDELKTDDQAECKGHDRYTVHQSLVRLTERLPGGTKLLKIGISFYGDWTRWASENIIRFGERYSQRALAARLNSRPINIWLKSRFLMRTNGLVRSHSNYSLLAYLIRIFTRLGAQIEWNDLCHCYNIIHRADYHSQASFPIYPDEAGDLPEGIYHIWLPQKSSNSNQSSRWIRYDLLYSVKLVSFTGFSVDCLIYNKLGISIRRPGSYSLMIKRRGSRENTRGTSSPSFDWKTVVDYLRNMFFG